MPLNFVNPALLAGGALIAGPIIIHLLNRRRFKQVWWAAMEFLLEAQRKNRRRVQIEHLILLMLRCLLIALIVMAVARPHSASASLIGGRASIDRVVIWDDSPSMEHVKEGKSAFDRSKEELHKLVGMFAENWRGDALTLLRTSSPGRPEFFRVKVEGTQRDDIRKKIDEAKSSGMPISLASNLQKLFEKFEKEKGSLNRVVYILSDFRAWDWEGKEDKTAEGDDPEDGPVEEASEEATGDGQVGLSEILKKYETEKTPFVMIDIGDPDTQNVGIISVLSHEPVGVAGVDHEVQIRLKNFGEERQDEVTLQLMLDGTPLSMPQTVRLDPLGEAVARVPLIITESGSHSLQIEIPSDRLRSDDRRAYAFPVVDSIPVMLVDGEPSSEWLDGEVDYLRVALNPKGAVRSGLDPIVVTTEDLLTENLEKFAVIVLGNVYEIQPARLPALEEFVKNGGGLIFFVGDNIAPEKTNEQFYKDGKGILPLPLGDFKGDTQNKETFYSLSPDGLDSDIFGVFEGNQNPLLNRFRIFKFIQMIEGEKPDPSVDVLARLDDPKRSAFVVSKRFGKGRVFQIATTVDDEWTNWTEGFLGGYAYLPTMLTMVKAARGRTVVDPNGPAGEPLSHAFDPGKYTAEVEWKKPGEEEWSKVLSRTDPDSQKFLSTLEETERAGLYSVRLFGLDGGEKVHHFATYFDWREGDLRKANPDSLKQGYPGFHFEWIGGADDLKGGGMGPQSELWKSLMMAFLAILFLEGFLAFKWGRGYEDLSSTEVKK